MNGEYSLMVKVSGCDSDDTSSILVIRLFDTVKPKNQNLF